jgi:tRNA pseudouridine38-40 synthase
MAGLERLKLIIAYDGSPFSGWQSQPNGNAIQDHLKRAFSQILPGPIKLHGAGRTDSGVHALGQVAHIDVPGEKLNLTGWTAAVNAHLPAEIRVIQCQTVPSDFHSRYSAVGKVYRYRIWNSEVFHPMEIGRAWHVPQALDFDILRAACGLVTGTHDFASFAANRGKAPETTIRTIYRIGIHRRKELLVLEFDGDGFLYRMVRMLTGTIVRVASKRVELDWMADLLANPGKTKTNCTAPAEGLYLVKVRYDSRAQKSREAKASRDFQAYR